MFMKTKNQLGLILSVSLGISWLSTPVAPAQTEAKPGQEATNSAVLIQALEARDYSRVVETLRASGLGEGTLTSMKDRLSATPARAKLQEPFLRAAIIGSVAGLDPAELKLRLEAATAQSFQPVFWEISSFGPDWQQRYDQERTRFAAAPIGVLDVGLADTNFVRFFQWYDRYGERLHSVVINWERLDNYDFKATAQQRDANRVMSGLYQLIKARNPTAFVWIRVVWADDNSDVRWLRALTFAPDGLLLWNLPAFDSPFEAARARYLPLLAPECPMVAAAFYGIWSRITVTKDLAGIGRTTDANLGPFEKRLAGAGLRGLAPDGLMLKAVALARSQPAKSEPSAANPALSWNLEALLGAYDKLGRKSPAWDPAAREALRLYAELQVPHATVSTEAGGRLGLSLYTAVQAGCDDPLIQFLHTLYYLHPGHDASIGLIQTTVQAADDLDHSGYAVVWKFLAALRTSEVLSYAAQNDTNNLPDLERFRLAAANHLVHLIQDPTIPESAGREACHDWIESRDLRQAPLQPAYALMEKPLFERWPNAGWAWALKGEFFVKYAWEARGNGRADTVTAQGWKLFFERLLAAQDSFEKAWQLDPTLPEIPQGMMTVELGQGQGLGRLELWFQRAMELNPTNAAPCRSKLAYLEPKWHGSAEAMLAFGRECVASEKWGGQVPLMLASAHETLCGYLPAMEQAAYWRQPGVWPDIQASYEKFFKLNPESARWHHNYARYAYWCEQWEELNKQLGLLGPVNYNFFGGREAYNTMVRKAKEQTGQKP